MGLTAIVYRNVDNLRKDYKWAQFDVDRSTGEALLAVPKEATIPKDAFVAARVRIGNLKRIDALREAVQSVFAGRTSTLIATILYSASHSGDVIKLSEIPKLREEVDLLKMHNSPVLSEFIDDLEILFLAAEKERNPIVFA